jgi:hypothetical protein
VPLDRPPQGFVFPACGYGFYFHSMSLDNKLVDPSGFEDRRRVRAWY